MVEPINTPKMLKVNSRSERLLASKIPDSATIMAERIMLFGFMRANNVDSTYVTGRLFSVCPVDSSKVISQGDFNILRIPKYSLGQRLKLETYLPEFP